MSVRPAPCAVRRAPCAVKHETLGLMRDSLIGIPGLLAAFAMNAMLDVYTDVPMLVRWAVAILVSLFVTFIVVRWGQRVKERDGGEALDRWNS